MFAFLLVGWPVGCLVSVWVSERVSGGWAWVVGGFCLGSPMEDFFFLVFLLRFWLCC